MSAIKKPTGEVTHNNNEFINVIGDFYRDVYSLNDQPRTEVSAIIRDVTIIPAENIKEILRDT